MCENLLIRNKLNEPINIGIYENKHKFVYVDNKGNRHVLLEEFLMKGVIDSAAYYKIENQYGLKSGYIFMVGEK